MISNFDNFLNEKLDYQVKVFSSFYPSIFKWGEDKLVISFRHLNMGMINLLELDKDSNFSTPLSLDEFQVYQKVLEIFSTTTRIDDSQKMVKSVSELEKIPLLSKWLENCAEKYKTRILSKRYGLS